MRGLRPPVQGVCTEQDAWDPAEERYPGDDTTNRAAAEIGDVRRSTHRDSGSSSPTASYHSKK
jgi:hypothetical protein